LVNCSVLLFLVIDLHLPGFAAFATSIGQPGFYEYFKLDATGPGAAYTNHILGAVNALFFFGATMGALIAGPLADKIGRKKTLLTAAIVSIIGGALTAGSVHVAMLIVVRILQGSGLGALATLVRLPHIYSPMTFPNIF
jgi:MFS family permease